MEVRPGYKLTEVGVIPEEWDSMVCSELCVKIQDGTHFSPKIQGHDYLYLTSKNIRFGYLDLTRADRIDAKQHESIYRRCDVKYGDLLITKDGANTGNAALNTLTEQFSLLSSVAFLRFDASKHCAAYFLQQLLSIQGQRRIKDAMSGNAITRLTLEKIRKFHIPVAPLLEQRAIAAALSDVDALLGSLERLIAKKRDLKQATMQQLLTGQTRLPGFSGEWKTGRLSDVVEKMVGGGTPSRTNPAFWGNEIFWATVKDLTTFMPQQTQESITKLGLTNSASNLIPAKTLITSTRMALGKAVIYEVDVAINQDLKALFLKFDTDLGFVYYWFQANSQVIDDLGSGSTMKGISITQLGSVPFPRLPLPEQTAIAAILSDMDAEIAALEARRAKTRALKQGMMQELLTGKTRLV